MKRMIWLGALLLLFGFTLSAQGIRVVVADNVPDAARAVLQQRFEQMMKAGGLTLEDEGAVLSVSVEMTDRMETAGSLPQVAVVLDVKASVAGVAEEVFPVKGVGEDEEDAIVRAVKQILPKSKAATLFVRALTAS